jgi:hypothetical protein
MSIQVSSQENGIKPQIWNNLYVVWNINDLFVVRNNLAYNVLLSAQYPWSELTYSATGAYAFHRFFEANAGMYVARANQSDRLKSYEFRPYLGLRITTNTEKRWSISNISRLELRFFQYSDQKLESAVRFRNRTYAAVSLNNPSLNDNHNLILFGYFEAFYNFNEEVRERFFNQFKYKLGFNYRLSDQWRFDFGVLYQDAKNTSNEPVPLNVTIITRYVIEWGVAYIIPLRKD